MAQIENTYAKRNALTFRSRRPRYSYPSPLTPDPLFIPSRMNEPSKISNSRRIASSHGNKFFFSYTKKLIHYLWFFLINRALRIIIFIVQFEIIFERNLLHDLLTKKLLLFFCLYNLSRDISRVNKMEYHWFWTTRNSLFRDFCAFTDSPFWENWEAKPASNVDAE